MRKTRYVMASVMALACVSEAQALSSFGYARVASKTINESYKVFGGALFKDATFKDSVKIFGPCKIFDSKVQGTLTLQGELYGRDSTFTHIKAQGKVELKNSTLEGAEVQGTVKLKKSKITGRLNLMGYLDADESELDEVKISTNEMKLKDTTVKSVFVRENHVDSKTTSAQQIVYLLGKTEISDNITFENGKGLVVIGKRVKKVPVVKGGRVHASL